MHIVYVCREYPPALRMGGIASYLKEIAAAMVRRGHRVTVIAANDDTRVERIEDTDGVHVIRLSGGDFVVPSVEPSMLLLKKFRMLYRFHSYRKKIRNTILKLDHVDVVEIADYGAEGYYLKDLKIPVTMRLHTPTLLDRNTGEMKKFSPSCFHEYWVGRMEFKMMPWYDHVTSCSHALLDWCQKHVPAFTDKGQVIFNALDMSLWTRDALATYEENTVFYAGTVAEAKGVGDLVRAVAKLNNSGCAIRLRIAGKLGSYGKSLTRYCQENGYDWCEFLGHISRDELKNYYIKSKVTCLPSWWEALSIVCLEAMALGNVVIGSKQGGMAEIITDGRDGFLIEPKNVDQLADCLRKALSLSTSQVTAMRSCASQRIRSTFSIDSISKQFEEYYESIR